MSPVLCRSMSLGLWVILYQPSLTCQNFMAWDGRRMDACGLQCQTLETPLQA